MRAIAKGLAGRVAATAESDCRATGKAVRFAFHVEELNFPFDAQGAVVADSYFCRWHSSSRFSEKASVRLKKWLRKNSKIVIPRAGFARGICFFLYLRKSRSLASLGVTTKPTFSATSKGERYKFPGSLMPAGFV
jgi:hypothetical protein